MTTDTQTPPGADETPTLETLRAASEASAEQADKDRTALLEAAVTAAMESTTYGHLTAVARRAGITHQYLRDLVDQARPGWLEWAAEQREAAKVPASAGKKSAASGAAPRKRGTARKAAPKSSAGGKSAA
ncbi:hypothetical protein ACFRKD_26810 [Streptomyces niveus]|uniref:hypothetical protein n=1 Tax=Streptomyces niveus TaxID=193462 RepID=UPI00368FB5D7